MVLINLLNLHFLLSKSLFTTAIHKVLFNVKGFFELFGNDIASIKEHVRSNYRLCLLGAFWRKRKCVLIRLVTLVNNKNTLAINYQ